ncbi:uncharacterized protein TNCV_2484181 [Trichonephila clavipes]|uniref:Reverse transcriptase RNase H-like domain-containing protein n=1 Tax=Trichonephila clavipes TaxID=2585209 RepID=A0A8X6VZ82_TRICX|nr:uncharacterized protein TNCV_2484181 [Trichonephila clavipes]
MAFLGKTKKQDLVLLAEELGQKVSDKMTNIDLKNIIIGSKDYEEEFVNAQLSVILEEHFERESEDGDIVLSLTLFERQAKHIGVEKTNWVSALLARMPSDITQLIARESEDKFDNYDYIKGVLLKRFKMSPETSRKKFMKHQRIPARSWSDFVFEITSYFEEWLDGMEINAVETNERFQEQSSAILTAKVAIPVYSPTKEDEKIDKLKFVRIKCGNKILKAVIDTGAQISMIRADVVEGQSVDSGGTIQIMSAFGKREVTEFKKLTETQTRWETTEREAYVVIEALKHFDSWVFGAEIEVISDHNPLTYLTLTTPQSSKLTRWALALQRYNVAISYRKGVKHGNADALSRLPIPVS